MYFLKKVVHFQNVSTKGLQLVIDTQNQGSVYVCMLTERKSEMEVFRFSD